MTPLPYRLIVARYMEDVDWVDAFEFYTIYNKGSDDIPSKYRDNVVALKNVGREAHTYIHHIVENYDNLDDVLIFSQGDFRQHIDCSPSEFRRRALNLGEKGFSSNLRRTGHVGSNARTFVLNEYQGPLRSSRIYDLGGWWEYTTGEAYVRSRSVFWSAIFSVSREVIRRRSRQSYQRILDTLSWCENPMEAHFCERAWFNIMNLPLSFVLDPHAPFVPDPPKIPSHSLVHYAPPPPPPLLTPDIPPPRAADFGFDLGADFVPHQEPHFLEESHPTLKDDSFGVKDLVERWAARPPTEDKSVIRVRRRTIIKSVVPPMISRGEILGLLDHVGGIMSSNEEDVRRLTEALRHNIEEWTAAKCPSYPLDQPFVSKYDLEDKAGWYVWEMACESMEVSTTGSTTGVPFKYMRWIPAFSKIEWDYHYNFVLDEFGVSQTPDILYFFPGHYKSEGTNPIACFGGPSDLPWNNHGTGRHPRIHFANFALYQKDHEGFFRYMFDYVQENEIDVVFTAPPQVSSMCNYIRKLGVKHKIAKLLSSTEDRILPADAKFLFLDNCYFDDICDHMRCWDGGATFYTCKHRNYHLMDNLAWVEEIDGKMICTDYFNLSSPFVRYWNGDYCRIGKDYQRCECGRLYREFEFMDSRPFSLKGVCMRDIKEGMRELGIPGIKEVRCSQSHLEVVSLAPIPVEDRRRIAALSDKFAFRFVTEEFHS